MTEQVSASHILVMHEDSPRSSETRSREDALALIEEAKGRIADGTEFGELATDVSDCPSASDGGSLGSFGRGSMVRAFEDAAFALEVGETSDIVETEFGYHLIHRSL